MTGKRIKAQLEKFDRDAYHGPGDALRIIKDTADAKFDETIELNLRLGVDPKKADQQLRGTVGLPSGSGKSVRVLAFAQGDKAKAAEAAGADFVGGEDLAEKIQGGWLEFDVAIASPDMMGVVGKLGQVLGPRGLMPNPKSGTVTDDVGKAVGEVKAGKIEYRTDKDANVHLVLGKASFSYEQLAANYKAVVAEIVRARPSSAKGRYIKNATISSTMGPGIKIDPAQVSEFMAIEEKVGSGPTYAEAP
jgi:large subunit ribosomal protein L1